MGRSNEDITRFADWIYTTGAARDFTLSPHRDWIHAKLSISQIEKLFEVRNEYISPLYNL